MIKQRSLYKRYNLRLSKISCLLWLIISLIGSVISPVVRAQDGYPQPQDLFVNDYANLLTATDAANVRDLFADLKRETGIEAVVVTIDSINDYETDTETIESFATDLFNSWGIGAKEKNNGVLLLVAVKDRKVRIEVGSGYGHSQDANMQEVINEHILPGFKQNQYSQGIYRGARAIVGKLTGNWPKELGAPTPKLDAPTSSPSRVTSSRPARSSSSSTNGVSWWSAIFGVATLGGGTIFGLTRYRRYRRRNCPHCQTSMERLDEVSDDVYLDSGQKLEEILKAVDYDVWKCPNCNYHTLHRYANWFSGLKACPSCQYRTLKSSSTTLSEPTYTSTGRKRITRECRHCHYHDEEIVTLPMLTRSDDNDSFSSSSSSSSSSSFGGGSSSGGGASGSW